MKVKITDRGCWYGGRVGETFNVSKLPSGWFVVEGTENQYISPRHCDVVED